VDKEGVQNTNSLCVCDPVVLLLDGLEEDPGVLKTSVGRIAPFTLVSHASAIRATGIRLLVIGSSRVPGKSVEA
jgi:hypothetical protein